MKNLSLVVFFLISSIISAQDQYVEGMEKAFGFWKEGKTTEAANMFERISNAEMDNWLPYYYVAQLNTINAFGEKDNAKLSSSLEKAQQFLDVAKSISPNNPEILVQQAMIHTAWIAYDGATYGMTLSGKVSALYGEALKLAPENPRVVYSKAQWDMGSAKYFGQDTTPYCKDIERSLELFANFKPESDFHPNWGKEGAEKILENCN